MKRLALASALALAACGGSPHHAADVEARTRSRGAPVELAVRGPNGEWLDFGDLRGAPTLVFLLTTFDGNCQAAVIPYARVARAHPEAHFVGIAVQPDARALLAAYRDALHLTFTVTYDADGVVLGGGSDLGHVETVPTFIALDAQGRVAGSFAGVPSARRLEDMLAEASR